MDLATLVGIVFSLIGIMIGIFFATGGNVGPYIDIPSVFIVIVGSIGATMTCFPLEMTTKGLAQSARLVFSPPKRDMTGTIRTIVDFAQKARREGLLALEAEAEMIDNPFLKKGIRLVVDGTDPELVRSILEIEIQYIDERHRSMINYYFMWGSLAPAFGMLGTVIGLVGLLLNMQDVSTIGPNMSTTLITTFYGSIIANIICNPFATKLTGINAEEMLLNEMIMEGILSMQAGENPRIIEEKLLVFLSIEQRNSLLGGRNQEES